MIKVNPPASQAQMVALSPAPPVTWHLVHESPLLRGSQYNSLPAAVLEVSESALYGMYSVHFLLGGFFLQQLRCRGAPSGSGESEQQRPLQQACL
jgi:hypothetical protein